MSNWKNWIIFLGLIVFVILFWPKNEVPEEKPAAPEPAVAPAVVKREKPASQPVAVQPAVKREVPPVVEMAPAVSADPDRKSKKLALPFKIVNGLVVVQGDVVVGAPLPGMASSGLVAIPPLQRWKGTIIPYHIQPDLPNPERVRQALAMFEGTNVRFVPHNNEADILVFEKGEKNCLSYLGKMGGHQPLWLAPNCGPAEIAHEIMHALGFMHEQNRADRDRYIAVYPENIDEDEIHNFEKLPNEFMNVSGLGPFDFNSIMIYPPWMFAKNGKSTMEPLNRDQLIQPGPALSPTDIERINRAYGAN